MKKRCFCCRKVKSLSDFYTHSFGMKDGHLNKCKACVIDYASRRRLGPAREKILAYDRERFQSPERKKKVLVYARRSRAKSPEKQRCRQVTRRAILSGALRKPSVCSVCHKPGKIEAHHHDYSRPLDVVWVCFSCHRSVFHPSKYRR